MNVSAKRVLLQYYKPLINSQPEKLESRYTCIGKFVSITVFKSEMNMYISVSNAEKYVLSLLLINITDVIDLT